MPSHRYMVMPSHRYMVMPMLVWLFSIHRTGTRPASPPEGHCAIQGETLPTVSQRPGGGLTCPFHLCFTAMSFLQWDQFMELGKDVDDSVIEEKIKAQRPEQCALVVYTVRINLIAI